MQLNNKSSIHQKQLLWEKLFILKISMHNFKKFRLFTILRLRNVLRYHSRRNHQHWWMQPHSLRRTWENNFYFEKPVFVSRNVRVLWARGQVRGTDSGSLFCGPAWCWDHPDSERCTGSIRGGGVDRCLYSAGLLGVTIKEESSTVHQRIQLII